MIARRTVASAWQPAQAPDAADSPGFARWHRRMRIGLFNAPVTTAIPIAVAAFLCVGTLDLISPRYVTFSAFYLIIIAYAAWSIGRLGGWIAGSAVILVGVMSDGLGGYVALAKGEAHAFAVVWSLAMRLLSCAAIIELTRGFRHSFDSARYLSNTDALTGLLNRRAFRDAAATSLAGTHAGGRIGIVLYADLDGFKQVNDRLGHAAGDAVLRRFADTLRGAVGLSGHVCRSGGDEFAACLDVPDEAASSQIVPHLQHVLNAELRALGHQGLSCSLGAAYVRPDAPLSPVDTLIGLADGLMYQAKQDRRAPIRLRNTLAKRAAS